MSSPRDRLVAAIEAWLADEARERIARARGAADADPPMAVAERHAALRGPRTRELFEEARERGLLDGDTLALSASGLRAAHAAVGRARAEERLRDALGVRVPHDSDHHEPVALVLRMLGEAHEGRRRAVARSLTDALAPRLLAALREGLADVEESLEGARWLREIPPPRDLDAAASDDAREVLRETEGAFVEVVERSAHAERVAMEAWADLLFVSRAPRFDAMFDPRKRWRRAAEALSALGVASALGKRARVEAAVSSRAPRVRSSVVGVAVPRDVRVVPPSLELGLASERDARLAVGRAVATTWTHPALPPLVARVEHGTVGQGLGALFAHLLCEPRATELSGEGGRALRERALLLELFELRTEAAAVVASESVASHAFAEAAEHALREAWRVEVPAPIAACACLADRGAPRRLRASRAAAPLFSAMRERYDEDWWRNPRAAEPLRAACERGPLLTVESWAEELGLGRGGLASRYAELLR